MLDLACVDDSHDFLHKPESVQRVDRGSVLALRLTIATQVGVNSNSKLQRAIYLHHQGRSQ